MRNTGRLNVFVLTAAVLAAHHACAGEAGMVRLAGTPEQIGTKWGEMNREIIVSDMDATYLRRAEKANISRETLIERSALFVRFAEKYAPHWLAEAQATARAAGVDEDLYIAFIDGQSRNRFLRADPVPDECTSYAVTGGHTANGLPMHHKTRDNVDRPQMAPMVESSLEGINKFIAVTDGSRIRCSVMINEKGLAGSGDATRCNLELPAEDPRFRGVMAGSILRYIAERASTCAEALAIIEKFTKEGYYAGGTRGSHWLFVDREGTILEVCNNSQHVVSKIHTEPVYFSRAGTSAAARRLRDAETVDFGMFRGASRQSPILNKHSIAGMTVEIDPDYPELLTCAWIALPARSVAIPVFMGQRSAPAGLFDGTANALGKRTAADGAQWEAEKAGVEALEEAMHAEKESLRQDVKASIAAGNPLEADVQRLESWSRDQAARIRRMP